MSSSERNSPERHRGAAGRSVGSFHPEVLSCARNDVTPSRREMPEITRARLPAPLCFGKSKIWSVLRLPFHMLGAPSKEINA